MGQARLRGTKESRVAEGIRKRIERDRQNEIERAERWRKMTPKEREMTIFLASLQAQFGAYP